MLLRRLLGGSLLLAFLAPALQTALLGASGFAPPRASVGGECCTAMPCCASGARCATGSCQNPASATVVTLPATAEDCPRLAAGCTGPATATPAADRDPMVQASGPASPAPRPHITAVQPLAWSASERANNPTVPPPRA